MKIGLIVLLAAIVTFASCEDAVKKTTKAGVFLGTIIKSRKGREIEAYRGIHYAEPPVDKLRFQAPVLIKSYPKVVDATADGPLCAGTSEATLADTSEDCLRVNVYIPKLKTSKPLPVIVYIRGGEFVYESGRSVTSGPEYLLDQDIILVTFNYRTGLLGFLSTGDKQAPGNNGLKDQVALLRWVQNNIKEFGGNPKSVTLMGDEAGAFSIGLHLISPLTSTDLFHRAILMGGSPTGQWNLPSNQLALAAKKAKLLGCDTSTSTKIVSCLKSAKLSDFWNKDTELYEFAQQDPMWLYKPVVEKDFGQERFITENPTKAFASGKIKNVPILIGVTELMNADHGFVVASNKTLRNQISEDWAKIASVAFELDGNRKAADVLKKEYLKGVDLVSGKENDVGMKLGKIYADAITGFSVHRLTKILASKISSKVYYYKFSYTGASSWYTDSRSGKPIGAVSRDDTIYIVQSRTRFTPIGTSGDDAQIVDVMTSLWANFATNSNPNPTSGQKSISSVKWPAYTSKEKHYLQISSPTDITSSTNLFEDRYAIWEKLFPLQ